jgi:membrane protease YdiL (CAAX protease family)
MPTLSTVVPGTRGEGAATAASAFSSQLRGFGPVGLLAVFVIFAGNLVVAPLSAVLVLVCSELSQTPWLALGFTRPRSWLRTCAIGLPLGVAFKLAMKALVMPLFGAPAMNPTYHYLAGNTAALPSILYAVVVGAGFGEEVVFRGFLFERSGRLFGRGRIAVAATVLITSGLFGLAHYSDQGVPGVEQAAVTGLVFGAIFAGTRQLWIPMIAHAAFDLTAVVLIYWNWESAVARFFFR